MVVLIRKLDMFIKDTKKRDDHVNVLAAMASTSAREHGARWAHLVVSSTRKVSGPVVVTPRSWRALLI